MSHWVVSPAVVIGAGAELATLLEDEVAAVRLSVSAWLGTASGLIPLMYVCKHSQGLHSLPTHLRQFELHTKLSYRLAQ